MIPWLGIAVVTSIAAWLDFVNLGSTTAFNDIVSLTLEGLFASYLIACCIFLYRIGERKEFNVDASTAAINTQARPYSRGPWRVPGIWLVFKNNFAIVHLMLVCFFSFWPTQTLVTAVDMNYSQTVWGAVAILSLSYYSIWAKTW